MKHTGDKDDDVNSAEFSADSRWLATAGDDGNVFFWEARTGVKSGAPLNTESFATFAAFSPNGQFVLTLNYDDKGQFWSFAKRTKIGPPLEHPGTLNKGLFSPDGHLVATISENTAKIWQVPKGTLLATLPHLKDVTQIAFSPDESFLATLQEEAKEVLLWKPDGSPLRPIKSTNQIRYFALSPSGSIIAIASTSDVSFWNCQTGAMEAPALDAAAVSVMFSGNGRLVLTSGTTVCLWERAPMASKVEKQPAQ